MISERDWAHNFFKNVDVKSLKNIVLEAFHIKMLKELTPTDGKDF